MDLIWFLMLTLHSGSAGCCAGQAQIKMPALECKLAAGATVCTVPAYAVCKAIADANKEAAFPLDCYGKQP